MSLKICVWYSFHPVNLNLNVASVWLRVGDLVYGLLVHLHAVNGQAGPCVQLLVANVTLKMLGFLMLDQNFLIIKFSVAIPTPWLTLLLLLSAHPLCLLS